MEKTAKIVRTTFKSEWKSPQGNQVYYHDIELDNGDFGSIGSKEKMPSKLNPGSELTYTIADGKIKAVVPAQGGFAGGGFKGKAPIDPRAQFIGFASAYAKDLVVAGKVELKDINGSAESIFKNMLKLYDLIK